MQILAGMPGCLRHVIFLVWTALHPLFLPIVCLSYQDLTVFYQGSPQFPGGLMLQDLTISSLSDNCPEDYVLHPAKAVSSGAGRREGMHSVETLGTVYTTALPLPSAAIQRGKGSDSILEKGK